MNGRILYYIGCGIGIVLFELALLNVMPIAGSIDILFIAVLLLLTEHKPMYAAIVGGVGSVLRDMLSITMFGTHLIVFFLIFLLMLVLSERVFTSKAFIAYVVFGIFIFALNNALYHLLVALTSNPHQVSSLFSMFPSYGITLIVNSSIIAFCVYFSLNKPSRISGSRIF